MAGRRDTHDYPVVRGRERVSGVIEYLAGSGKRPRQSLLDASFSTLNSSMKTLAQERKYLFRMPRTRLVTVTDIKLQQGMRLLLLALTGWTANLSAQVVEPEMVVPPLRQAVTACPTLEELGYFPRALTDIRLSSFSDAERLPDDCSVNLFSAPHGWEQQSANHVEFNWAASELYAQPAYFDDPILERYGQSHRPLLQPWLSGAHFFGTFALMPYKIGLDRTHDPNLHVGVLSTGQSDAVHWQAVTVGSRRRRAAGCDGASADLPAAITSYTPPYSPTDWLTCSLRTLTEDATSKRS